MKKLRDKAFKDYRDGAKMPDIATKYDVPFNTVKSWARRHWKLKQGTQKGETIASKGCKRVQPRPHGAPIGNRNNYKHGVYTKYIPDEEKEILYNAGFGRGDIYHDKALLCKLRRLKIENCLATSVMSMSTMRRMINDSVRLEALEVTYACRSYLRAIRSENAD